MTAVAAWLIVIVVGFSLFMLFIGNPVIDWLDDRTSRITPAEARHRARLTLLRQWPPLPKVTMLTPRAFIVVFIGLALLGWASWRLTR